MGEEAVGETMEALPLGLEASLEEVALSADP